LTQTHRYTAAGAAAPAADAETVKPQRRRVSIVVVVTSHPESFQRFHSRMSADGC